MDNIVAACRECHSRVQDAGEAGRKECRDAIARRDPVRTQKELEQSAVCPTCGPCVPVWVQSHLQCGACSRVLVSCCDGGG